MPVHICILLRGLQNIIVDVDWTTLNKTTFETDSSLADKAIEIT